MYRKFDSFNTTLHVRHDDFDKVVMISTHTSPLEGVTHHLSMTEACELRDLLSEMINDQVKSDRLCEKWSR